MMDQVVTIIISSALTGIISSVATMAGLKVHITYLRESVGELKSAVTRAHERIDRLEKC